MKKVSSFNNDQNTLYIVSTPIGNLEDITYRAINILKKVSLILAEDTRVTEKILHTYDIKTPLMSYHLFNEYDRIKDILEKLKEGDIALVSDAGTPLISDPGYLLVKETIKNDFNVVSIPGPSALLAGLVVSGIKTDKISFLGFLPKKKSEFKKELRNYIGKENTLVLYESPLRIKNTINDIYQVLGNRLCSLSRELTKKFETIYYGDLVKAISYEFPTKGEYVIVVAGTAPLTEESANIIEKVNYYINHGLDEKTSIKLVSNILKISKSEVYKTYKGF